MKAAEHSTSAPSTNDRDSRPLGTARRAVRGFFASISASSSRFAAIATVRAATMQTTTSASLPASGPRTASHAITADRIAHGIANTVWLTLMSAANVESFCGRDGATTEEESIVWVIIGEL